MFVTDFNYKLHATVQVIALCLGREWERRWIYSLGAGFSVFGSGEGGSDELSGAAATSLTGSGLLLISALGSAATSLAGSDVPSGSGSAEDSLDGSGVAGSDVLSGSGTEGSDVLSGSGTAGSASTSDVGSGSATVGSGSLVDEGSAVVDSAS